MIEPRYVSIPLNRIVVQHQEDFNNYWLPRYGECLGKILYNYTFSPSLSVFDQNKDQIKDGFLEYDKSKFKQRNLFFYRLEKIIRLTEWWLKNQKWRDPVVVVFLKSLRPIETNLEIENSLDLYGLRIGNDRMMIMQSLGVTEYTFLEFDKEYIKDNNLDQIRSFWGDYSSNVRIDSRSDGYVGIQNKDNADIILKFEKTIAWLKSDKTILEFLKK
jgi:hypothetical protein